MPIAADDLEVGDLVVVSAIVDDTPLSWEQMYKRRRENQDLNGKPWKIVIMVSVSPLHPAEVCQAACSACGS